MTPNRPSMQRYQATMQQEEPLNRRPTVSLPPAPGPAPATPYQPSQSQLQQSSNEPVAFDKILAHMQAKQTSEVQGTYLSPAQRTSSTSITSPINAYNQPLNPSSTHRISQNIPSHYASPRMTMSHSSQPVSQSAISSTKTIPTSSLNHYYDSSTRPLEYETSPHYLSSDQIIETLTKQLDDLRQLYNSEVAERRRAESNLLAAETKQKELEKRLADEKSRNLQLEMHAAAITGNLTEHRLTIQQLQQQLKQQLQVIQSSHHQQVKPSFLSGISNEENSTISAISNDESVLVPLSSNSGGVDSVLGPLPVQTYHNLNTSFSRENIVDDSGSPSYSAHSNAVYPSTAVLSNSHRDSFQDGSNRDSFQSIDLHPTVNPQSRTYSSENTPIGSEIYQKTISRPSNSNANSSNPNIYTVRNPSHSISNGDSFDPRSPTSARQFPSNTSMSARLSSSNNLSTSGSFTSNISKIAPATPRASSNRSYPVNTPAAPPFNAPVAPNRPAPSMYSSAITQTTSNPMANTSTPSTPNLNSSITSTNGTSTTPNTSGIQVTIPLASRISALANAVNNSSNYQSPHVPPQLASPRANSINEPIIASPTFRQSQQTQQFVSFTSPSASTNLTASNLNPSIPTSNSAATKTLSQGPVSSSPDKVALALINAPTDPDDAIFDNYLEKTVRAPTSPMTDPNYNQYMTSPTQKSKLSQEEYEATKRMTRPTNLSPGSNIPPPPPLPLTSHSNTALTNKPLPPTIKSTIPTGSKPQPPQAPNPYAKSPPPNKNTPDDLWDFDMPNTHFNSEVTTLSERLIGVALESWATEFNFSADMRQYVLGELTDAAYQAHSELDLQDKIQIIRDNIVNSPFVLEKQVGSGGFGSVYRGIVKATGEPAAIKIINFEDTSEDVSVIYREIGALAQTSKCPQLISYMGSEVHGTKLWIIMEYADSGSVHELIRKLAPSTLEEKYIAVIAREVLLGLNYLASVGKIHRDIKAANVLMTKDGGVKLADFGASRSLTDTLSKCNTFVGSPYWMAPEVMMASDYDGQADIWSLGIFCLEMAHGKPPHNTSNHIQAMQLIVKEAPPTLIGAKWSQEFRDFVSMCLVKNPQHRASLSELLKTKFIKNAKKTKILVDLLASTS